METTQQRQQSHPQMAENARPELADFYWEPVESMVQKDYPIAGEYLLGSGLETLMPDEQLDGQIRSIDEWWPEPDWEELGILGVEPQTIAYLYFLRKNLARRPPMEFGKADKARWVAWYNRASEILGGLIEEINTTEDCLALGDRYLCAFGWQNGCKPEDAEGLAPYALSRLTGRQLRLPFDFTPSTAVKITGAAHLGWPQDASIDPDVDVSVMQLRNKLNKQVRWAAVRVDTAKWVRLGEAHENVWDAVNDAKAEIGKQEIAVVVQRETPRRPELIGAIGRIGPQKRKAPVKDSDAFMREFGFRGIRFAACITSGERQELLDAAWDALHDLADFLGTAPCAVSLNGVLEVMFGASAGQGVYGHYERQLSILNLPRLAAAGEIAHEWAHALDHHFGVLAVKKGLISDIEAQPGPFMSETISKRPMPHGSWKNIEASPGGMAMLRIMRTLEGGVGDSQYFREAKNGSKYRSEPPELFARAFEVTVFDWLMEHGRSSNYLVHGVEAGRFADASRYTMNPYPVGEERDLARKRIEEALAIWAPHLDRTRKTGGQPQTGAQPAMQQERQRQQRAA